MYLGRRDYVLESLQQLRDIGVDAVCGLVSFLQHQQEEIRYVCKSYCAELCL